MIKAISYNAGWRNGCLDVEVIIIRKEIWKNLIYQNKQYKIFKVSNTGLVKNINTNVTYKLNKNSKGYIVIRLSLENEKISISVHKAVAETFIPNPNNYPVVNHKDGNKTNNVVENLEWCDIKYNNKHARDNGLKLPSYGENNGRAKLKEKDVFNIRMLYKKGDKKFGAKPLARMFNVSSTNIKKIVDGIFWKHLL